MSSFNPVRTLEGEDLLLREITPDDYQGLYSAMSDPSIWIGHPKKNRYQEHEIQTWFKDALKENALVIIDKSLNEIIGSSRYYETDIKNSETSIGYTFLCTKYWGGKTNRELKELMFHHAWEYFDKVWLHIAENNIRSRKAAEKIGAKLDHIGPKNNESYCWYLLAKNTI